MIEKPAEWDKPLLGNNPPPNSSKEDISCQWILETVVWRTSSGCTDSFWLILTVLIGHFQLSKIG